MNEANSGGTRGIRTSVIISVLESYAVVRAQCRHLSRMFFSRSFAILSEDGQLVRDRRALREAGRTEQNDAAMRAAGGVHQNTFAIRRELFLDAMNGGYDESLCAGGGYGGDDVEFNHRYAQLVDAGLADRDVLGPEIHVYPDAAENAEFHGLSRS